ncbi:MAG: hypothetical protein ACI81A_000675 [Paraglaciecola sp.]|jgi:hypothetical protein
MVQVLQVIEVSESSRAAKKLGSMSFILTKCNVIDDWGE